MDHFKEPVAYTAAHQSVSGSPASSWQLTNRESGVKAHGDTEYTMPPEEMYRLTFVRRGRNGEGRIDAPGDGMWREGRRFDFSR